MVRRLTALRCSVRNSSAARPKSLGLAAHRGLERLLAAREHELRTEHRQPQPLGLAVQVGGGADVVLPEELAQVDRLRLVVGMAALVVEPLALEVLAEAQLGGGASPAVVVGMEMGGAGPALVPEPEVEVEQPLERR